MRTNIEIDDELMRQAMAASQAVTKKAAVEAALRLTVRLKKQGEIRRLFGKVQWDGDLDAMRQSRVSEWGGEGSGLEELHRLIELKSDDDGDRLDLGGSNLRVHAKVDA